jgi:phosphoribosylformylglycinamidine (FGAM) synthase PurS component
LRGEKVVDFKLRKKDHSELESIKSHLTEICKKVATNPADYFYF